MTASTEHTPPSDEELVAFLDGELPLENRRRLNSLLAESAETRQRLERLRAGDRPFREAFDMLAEHAPNDRLAAILDHAARPAEPHTAAAPSAAARAPQGLRASMAAAAAILLALVGGFTGGLLMQTANAPAAAPEIAEAAAPQRGWRQAVADYQTLFTTDSLTPYQGGDSGIELASAKVGLKLQDLAQDMDDLNFRRVQVLQFNGKPLVQFAFLSADGLPVSFCVIRSGKEPAPEAFETRNDLGVVHWVDKGFGFMVIGGMPQDRLTDVAHKLRTHVPA